MTGPSPPCRPPQISAVLAWAARLAAGPAAGTIETAAYLTAKAAVLERIAAEREQAAGPPKTSPPPAEAAARARQPPTPPPCWPPPASPPWKGLT